MDDDREGYSRYAKRLPEESRRDGQGNPVDARGILVVDNVKSVDYLTREDFIAPTRNVRLPDLPRNVDEAIGANGKPVVIKRSIFEKNFTHHPELSPVASKGILKRALYNPDLVGQTQPVTRPNYMVAVQTGDGNAVTVLEVTQSKENVEIVGWRDVNERGLELMKKQAAKEGGQLLVLRPSEGGQSVGFSDRHRGLLEGNVSKKVDGVNGGGRDAQSVQGTDYTVGKARALLREDIEAKVAEAADAFGTDIQVVGVELHGSRVRGDARRDSDLDVVVEYRGDVGEDALFDALNESPINFNGLRVDVNPIRADKSGTLAEYMARSNAYDRERSSAQPAKKPAGRKEAAAAPRTVVLKDAARAEKAKELASSLMSDFDSPEFDPLRQDAGNGTIRAVDWEKVRATVDALSSGTLRHPRFTRQEVKASNGTEHSKFWNIVLSLEPADVYAGGGASGPSRTGGDDSQGGKGLGLLRELATRYGRSPVEVVGERRKYLDGGVESKVFLNENGKVVKVRRLSAYSIDGVVGELAKIAYHNYLFPKDAYTLVDLAVHENGGYDEYYLVLEQPFVTPQTDGRGNIVLPTDDQIFAALQGTPERFSIVNDAAESVAVEAAKMMAYNGQHVVYDFQPGRNTFIDAKTGEVRFIDPRVNLNDPGAGFSVSRFGERNSKGTIRRKSAMSYENYDDIAVDDGLDFDSPELDSARREYDEVVARYTNADGTRKPGWMKAPNGKPTNLTERQWVQVRTPAFKRWFGDWERLADTSLVEISLEDARKAIAEMRRVRFANESTGVEVELSASAVGKLVSNKATGKSLDNGFTRGEHNAIAARVGRLFELAALVEDRPDRDGDANILSIKRFATPVRFGEKEACAYITVKESKQHGSHIYSVEAIKLEALNRKVEEAANRAPHALSAPLAGISDSVTREPNTGGNSESPYAPRSIAEFFGGINPAAVSKVVDENGEPLVVYHGTNATEDAETWNARTRTYDVERRKFTVFRRDAAGGRNAGHFFSDSADVAGSMGGEVYAVHLALRSPLVVDAQGRTWGAIPFEGGLKDANEIAAYAEAHGHDGLILRNVRDGAGVGEMERPATDYVVFDSRQVKSATDNAGAFDAENHDIRFDSPELDSLSEEERKSSRLVGRVNPRLREEVEAALNTDRNTEAVLSGHTEVVFAEGTPQVLQDVGIQDGRIYTHAFILRKIRKDHDMDADGMLRLADAMSRPVAILRDVMNKNEAAYIILTEQTAKDLNGRIAPVMVYLREDKRGNYLASAYSKTENGERQFVNLVNAGGLLALNKNKVTDLNLTGEVKSSFESVKIGDKVIDLSRSTPYIVPHPGPSVQGGAAKVTPAEDAAYLDAVRRGDMEAAQRLLKSAWERSGYSDDVSYKDAHAAPSAPVEAKDFRNAEALTEARNEGWDLNLWAVAKGITGQPDDFFSDSGPRLYGYDDAAGREAQESVAQTIDLIRAGVDNAKIIVYRAVPKSVKLDMLQSGGQWVSPSRTYVENHGKSRFGIGKYRVIREVVRADELWWDGNDAREWGYDDGRQYVYMNDENGKKLATVTYDGSGNVIPLGERFNPANPGIDFDSPELDSEAFRRRVDAMERLVATLREEGYGDFRSLEAYLAENFPQDRFNAARPYLRGLWNAMEERMKPEGASRDATECVRRVARSWEAANAVEGQSAMEDLKKSIEDGGAFPNESKVGEIARQIKDLSRRKQFVENMRQWREWAGKPSIADEATRLADEVDAAEDTEGKAENGRPDASPNPKAGNGTIPQGDPLPQGTETTGRMRGIVTPQSFLKEARRLFPDVAIRGKGTARMATWAGGHFESTFRVIRSRDLNAIGTVAHELGHELEHLTRYDLPRTPAAKRDLSRLGHDLYPPNGPKPNSYIGEGFAEYVRGYICNAANLSAVAPDMDAWFRGDFKTKHPEIVKKIDRLRDMVQTLKEQSAADTVRGFRHPATTVAERAWKKATNFFASENWNDSASTILKGMRKSGIDKLYRWQDEFKELEAAVKVGDMAKAQSLAKSVSDKIANNPYLFPTIVRGTASQRVMDMARYGTTNLLGNRKTGESLKEIFADFSHEEQEDWKDYAIARHGLENYYAKGLEFGLPKDTLEAVVRQYESPKFRQALQRVTDYSHRILHLDVDAGLLSQETYDSIVASHPIYVRITRRKADDMAGTRQGGAAVSRRTGGFENILDPIDAMLMDEEKFLRACFQARSLQLIIGAANRAKAASLKSIKDNGGPNTSIVDPKEQSHIAVGAYWPIEVPNAQEKVTFSAGKLGNGLLDAATDYSSRTGEDIVPIQQFISDLATHKDARGQVAQLSIFHDKPSQGKHNLVSRSTRARELRWKSGRRVRA